MFLKTFTLDFESFAVNTWLLITGTGGELFTDLFLTVIVVHIWQKKRNTQKKKNTILYLILINKMKKCNANSVYKTGG